jgi:hypothetical protein
MFTNTHAEDTPGAIAKRGAKRGPMGKSGIRAKVVPKAKAGTKTGAGVQKRVRKGAKEAAA